MIASTLKLRIRRVSGLISTDDIIPGRYKHMFTDPAKLARHVFENLMPGFAATLKPGDALHSSDTFGIGSSREQAVSALMAAGILRRHLRVPAVCCLIIGQELHRHRPQSRAKPPAAHPQRSNRYTIPVGQRPHPNGQWR